jgi:hypothetical protein
MKYSLRHVPESDSWGVLKCVDGEPPLILATFSNPWRARWCLGSLRASIEVQNHGAEVEEPATYPAEPARNIPADMPDELVW